MQPSLPIRTLIANPTIETTVFRAALALSLLILPSAAAHGQAAGAGKAGHRTLLARAEEIALAESGAPATVTVGARILALTDSGFVEARPGSTGVTCLVNRSWPDSLEPECFDPEASATIMPMELWRTERYQAGATNADVENEINAGLAAGRFRLPGRPAVVYMMSAEQRLISDEGQPAGHWKPHVMIHFPFLTNEAVGLHGDAHSAAGSVVDSGRPTANLTIVVTEFVSVRRPGADR